MSKLSQIVRTRETYFEKIQNLSNSSIKSKKIAIEDFESFVKREYDIQTCEQMISELKEESENVMYDVFQKWINGMDLASPQVRFGHLNGYLYYHGIKIIPLDVKNNLTFKKSKKREQYALKREQIADIISPVKHHKKALYLALVSSGMRIGEALQIKKSDLDFSRSRIKIVIPADIAKNGYSRYTWMSDEARKYNIKRINSLSDDDLIWGSKNSSKWETNVVNQGILFGNYVDNARLGMKYASGTRKITLHSLRAYFITKGNKSDFGFGHALAGHDYYMKSYDRYDEDEMFDMYLKLEPYLGIFDLTLLNQQIVDLQTANQKFMEMKKQNDIMWDYHKQKIISDGSCGQIAIKN